MTMADLPYHLLNSVLKQEDFSDIESEANGSRGSSLANAAIGRDNKNNRSHSPNQDANQGLLIPFDDGQAALTAYPPGCSVLHVNAATTSPPVITAGKVDSVSFNVTSKELVYRVKPNDSTTEEEIMASEVQLQYAPSCKVQAEVNDENGSKSIMGTVVTSYQSNPNAAPCYSLQEDGPSGSLFHGIRKDAIKYRTAPATTPVSIGYDSHALDPTSIWGSRKEDTTVLASGGWSQSPSSTASDDNQNGNTANVGEEEKWNELLKLKEKYSNETLPQDSVSPSNDHSHFQQQQQQQQDPLIDAKFVVPGCAFTVDSIREFVYEGEVVPNIMRDTQCQIHLKFYKGDGLYRRRAIYFELRGTRDATYNAIHELEGSLVATLDRQEKGHTLYYMALLNEHRQKNTFNKVVRQFCYHFDKKGMWYILARRLPKNEPKAIAILIGRNGCNHKRMMKESKCRIEINADSSRDPHYVIYGHSENLVVACGERIEACLADAADIISQEALQELDQE